MDGWMEFQVELSFKVNHNIRSLNSLTHHSDRDRWFGISAFFLSFSYFIYIFFPRWLMELCYYTVVGRNCDRMVLEYGRG